MIISPHVLVHYFVLGLNDLRSQIDQVINEYILLHDFSNFRTGLEHFVPSELANEVS
jgi:hypothetical protein